MQTSIKQPALVFVIGILIYAASLANGFVYDDFPQIAENVWIRDFKNLPQVFFSSAWGFQEGVVTNYYRPMMNAVFTLEYALFGLKPWAFHALNAVIHGLNATLLYLIARRVVDNEIFPAAFVAGVLFAVHPICTEAVLWASGIPELTFTFFLLLSFLLFIKGSHLASGALFFLSALSKETSMALPVLLVVYDLTTTGHRPLREWAKRYWPIVVAIIVYFALRLNALGSFAPEENRYPMAAFDFLVNSSVLAAKYLKLLILPIDLNILHTFKPVTEISARELISIIAVVLTIIVLAYSFISRRLREARVPLMLVWVIVPLLPVLLTFQVREFPFSERYLYLSSAGLALLIGTVLSRIPGGKRGGLIVFIIIAVLYSLGTLSRIPDWKNNFTLWSEAAGKAPDNFYTRYSLGVEYMARGEDEAAAVELKEAGRLKPDYFNAPYNLGLVYFRLGMLEESIAVNMTAASIAKNPSDEALARVNAGNALARSGRLSEAVEAYRRALAIDPANQTAMRNLGVVTGMMRRNAP